MQTRLRPGSGNCTEASFASLLGIPLDRVPDLWARPTNPDATLDEHQPLENRIRLWEWLKTEHGLMVCGVRVDRRPDLLSAYVNARAFLREQAGIDASAEWGRYHVSAGKSPRFACDHAVVCRRGVLVHDPNPAGGGLDDCGWVEWLVPLALVPADARDLASAEWRADADAPWRKGTT